MIDNPYAPPSTDFVTPPQPDMFRELKSQSTWRLFGLGVITYGVYYAHYCATQSKVINRHSGTDSIPLGLVLALFALSYASLALFFGYMLVDEGHPIAIASNVADKLWLLLVLVWGFYARNSVNAIAGFTVGDPRWIHGLWTFLFSPLHFNYKINVINQESVATGSGRRPATAG
jgi:hypothetical protein